MSFVLRMKPVIGLSALDAADGGCDEYLLPNGGPGARTASVIDVAFPVSMALALGAVVGLAASLLPPLRPAAGPVQLSQVAAHKLKAPTIQGSSRSLTIDGSAANQIPGAALRRSTSMASDALFADGAQYGVGARAREGLGARAAPGQLKSSVAFGVLALSGWLAATLALVRRWPRRRGEADHQEASSWAMMAAQPEDDKDYDVFEEYQALMRKAKDSPDDDWKDDDEEEDEGDAASATSLGEEIGDAFMKYAMSVMLGRALPDVRDGLKPVQRRILYAMKGLGLGPGSGFRKSARVVGEVLGKYHPHGDTSVYEAMVRLAQDFVMSEMLVDGHGNFGSIDADPPAAMRYTECRLRPLASAALMEELDAETVDFVPNFDGSEEEPVILPARLPLLLINGASGIAVGMATTIPPHNLGEVCDAALLVVRARKASAADLGGPPPDERVTDAALQEALPGPDFPTGGLILGVEGIAKMYATGEGSVVMRARTNIETIGRRQAIIVTELPYQVVKAELLGRMAKAVNAGKLQGIADLRDESDRQGIRIVIEVKNKADPTVLLNNIFKSTRLQTTFSARMVAIAHSVEGPPGDGTGAVAPPQLRPEPQVLPLRRILNDWLDFRYQCVVRSKRCDLRKAEARQHILRGMRIATGRIDDVVRLVRGSADAGGAKAGLCLPEDQTDPSTGVRGFGLSATQADAVLALQLSRLTALAQDKVEEEYEKVTATIKSLEGLLGSDEQIYGYIEEEVVALRGRFARARRTEILTDGRKLEDELPPSNDRTVVTVTDAGLVKRMCVSDFRTQANRGNVGTAVVQNEATIAHFFACNTHDIVFSIMSDGRLYMTPAFKIPQGSRKARGTPIHAVLATPDTSASLTSILAISRDLLGPGDGGGASGDEGTEGGAQGDEEEEGGAEVRAAVQGPYLVLLTKMGYIKKLPVSYVGRRGGRVIALQAGDAVCRARICTDGDDLVIGSTQGMTLRFTESAVRPHITRATRGIRAMKLGGPHESLADLAVLSPDANNHLLVVTSQGYGKRVDSDLFRPLSKCNLRGVKAVRLRESREGGEVPADTMTALKAVGDDDELILISSDGSAARLKSLNIPAQSRTARGVVLRKSSDDPIKQVTVVPRVED